MSIKCHHSLVTQIVLTWARTIIYLSTIYWTFLESILLLMILTLGELFSQIFIFGKKFNRLKESWHITDMYTRNILYYLYSVPT